MALEAGKSKIKFPVGLVSCKRQLRGIFEYTVFHISYVPQGGDTSPSSFYLLNSYSSFKTLLKYSSPMDFLLLFLHSSSTPQKHDSFLQGLTPL